MAIIRKCDVCGVEVGDGYEDSAPLSLRVRQGFKGQFRFDCCSAPCLRALLDKIDGGATVFYSPEQKPWWRR